ncbi:MAG TPA: glycosyltransferase family 87 protein [Oculatellaceae cyanobacterium]
MKIYLIFVLLILVTVGVNTISHNFLLKQRWNLWLGYGVPALYMIIFMWIVSDHFPLFSDFNVAYYPAGRLILQNPSELFQEDDLKNILGFVNIPIIAILFTPFSFLSLPNAHLLLAVLSGLAIFTACYFLVKLTKVSGSERLALLGLFVINGPLYYSLRQGNSTHFVLLLLLAGLFCIQAKREIWLGSLLAIAGLLKIPLFLLGIYYLMRGRLRVVVGFSATLLAILGASLILFGFDLHLAWFQHCIQPYAGKPMPAFNVQSVDGFLARLLTNSDLIKWVPIEVSWDFKVIRYALLSLLVGTAIWVCWRSKPPSTLEVENLEFSIVLCLALVISPISWTHYYLFLLLPLSLYLGKRLAVPKGQLWFNLVLLSTLLISLPVKLPPQPSNPVLSLVISKFLVSHYFFGGLLLLGVLLAARWQNSKRVELS